MSFSRNIMVGAALLLSTFVAASAADNTHGSVVQSGGNLVPQNPSLPKLSLNAEQREQIRQALLTSNRRAAQGRAAGSVAFRKRPRLALELQHLTLRGAQSFNLQTNGSAGVR